jgi:hypothetical protein
MNSTRFLRFALLLATGALLHSGHTAAAPQPPAKEFNPPKVINMRLPDGKVKTTLRGYLEFGMIFDHDIPSAEKRGQLRLLRVHRPIFSADRERRIATWTIEWDELKPGQLVSFFGGLYRWNEEKFELHRIDAGPIPAEKMFDPAILTHQLGVFDGHDGMQWKKVGFGEPVGEEEAASFDAIIHAKGLRIGQWQVPDDPQGRRFKEPFRLKRGDIVTTARWEVKVLRILRPNEDAKHPGWVELSVKYRPL